MAVPTFEIFSGRSPEVDVVWIECIEGLGQAIDRMNVLAAENPGPYFVFSVRSHEVLASVNTDVKVQAGVA